MASTVIVLLLLASTTVTVLAMIAPRMRTVNQRQSFSLLMSTSSRLTVFDDVFDRRALEAVDRVAKEGGLGHVVFDRRASPPRTAVEAAIDAVLRALGDDSAVAEYWWREEWMNLEAHRDLDERRARVCPDEPLRVPSHAHVLYVAVGDDVQGPTVILHDAQPRTVLPDGSICVAAPSGQQYDKITTVPAVAGRVLRFDGSLMHAVPRPALVRLPTRLETLTLLLLLRTIYPSPSLCTSLFAFQAYFDPEEGGSNLELWTRRRPVDGNDPELTVYRRSVLLFNTWNEAPLEISTDPPSGISSVDPADLAVKCNAVDTWGVHACEEPVGDEGSRLIHMKVGLLGDQRRRERSARYLHLMGPEGIKAAMVADASKVPRTFRVQESDE